MSRRTTLHTIVFTAAVMLLAFAVGCSTTSRLTDDEVLYTGVKRLEIKPTDKEQLPSGMVSQIKKTINVPPNNPMPLMSPYVRTPFPVGLWVWNHWSDSAKGFKGWLYRQLVREPVLISDVRPQVRAEMIKDILDRNGYMASTAYAEIIPDKKNDRKARVSYFADVSKPYLIDSVIFLNQDSTLLCQLIDSMARLSKSVCKGQRFCVDSLIAERTRYTNVLRNRGFYYFRPDYIEYLADSTLAPQRITLKMTLAKNIPHLATLRYRTGKITTTIQRYSTRNPGVPDTFSTSKGNVIVMRPAKIRHALIPECITFRTGRYFTVRNMDRTQNRLARLGIFSSIDVQALPADTTDKHATLDVDITCRLDRPMEASIGVDVSSKSNSYIGPGLNLGLTNHNLFGGGEKLNIQLDGRYEWQTGHKRSSAYNSYELGLSATLGLPRLLAPRFIPRTHRELNWTNFKLSGSLLNRPDYFKITQFNAEMSYEWRATRNTLHQLWPFKLTYNKLLSTTPKFDDIMDNNPAIAQSFRSQFIPQISYTYTLDKYLERAKNNGINFTASVTEAGNIFNLIYLACGKRGEKTLFGLPFSQFIKGQAQLVYNHRLVAGTQNWLVTRVLIGAEHAYGNSSEVPYSEQFYIGGANSIRAFTTRSLGPGSYRAPDEKVNGYFDQTGTFKLEANAEYRFPIIGVLHGAVFLDAGNIWLLKNDPSRPGGKLERKTFARDIALGTGVGLRVDLGMIVVRGDLGYGLHAPYHTGIPGYINIQFKDAFAFHLAIGYPF